MKSRLIQALEVTLLATILSFGINHALAWTAPDAAPPNGTITAPINTSSITQTKAGNLSVANLGTNSIVFPDGSVQTKAATSTFEIINATSGTSYARSYKGKIMVEYIGHALQGANSSLSWSFLFNGTTVSNWAGSVNYQVMTDPSYYYTTSVNGSFTVELTMFPNVGQDQIIIWYL